MMLEIVDGYRIVLCSRTLRFARIILVVTMFCEKQCDINVCGLRCVRLTFYMAEAWPLPEVFVLLYLQRL